MDYDLRELPKEEELKRLAQGIPNVHIPSIEAVMQLLALASAIERTLEDHCAKLGFSQSRFFTLLLLYRYRDRGLTPSELADKMGFTRGNMTGILANLEKAGYVRRELDPSDRRLVYLSVTPKATKVIEAKMPRSFQARTKFMSVLSHAEIQGLTAMILKLRANTDVLRASWSDED